ncbi:MAG TPA: CrcB family protein [Streptosporangiaceae bacterium]|nr:CrcB family protein [Streptosporangiaceae bacterium]
MSVLVAVLIGGMIGAVARQEFFSTLQQRARTRFPVGILVVNLTGAFILGLLFGAGASSHWPQWLATGVQTGVIGAYTTYSTWAVDSLALARGGAGRESLVNLAGSLLAGVLLAWAGASVGSMILGHSRAEADKCWRRRKVDYYPKTSISVLLAW